MNRGPDRLMRLGETIGAAVRESFARSPGRREDFTDCAEQVLSTTPEVAEIQPRKVLELLASQGSSGIAPMQFQSRFSDLQLMLHVEDDFIVQLLFWTNATTSVHDHFFAGAFRVVEGSSLHCNYAFEREGGTQGFGWGRLALREAELLAAGDVRRVCFGPSTIHSVFHLEIPSVSLLVASSLVRPGERQLEYSGGRLAIDMAKTDHFLTKRIQALKILATSGPLMPHLEGFLGGADAQILHSALVALDPEIARLDPIAQARVEEVVLGHPQGGAVLGAIRAEKIVSRLMQMRRRIQDPLARFLLAMIINVPEPERWPELVARRLGAGAPAAIRPALATLFGDQFWTLVGSERDVETFAASLGDYLTGGGTPERLRHSPLAPYVFPLAPAPLATEPKAVGTA
ncbi:MAG TPA: hypothetical protein VEZ70_06830 [Allosphingosinicella sp.]|nr:hypothetical protein [Allosphingosinicella sp.]